MWGKYSWSLTYVLSFDEKICTGVTELRIRQSLLLWTTQGSRILKQEKRYMLRVYLFLRIENYKQLSFLRVEYVSICSFPCFACCQECHRCTFWLFCSLKFILPGLSSSVCSCVRVPLSLFLASRMVIRVASSLDFREDQTVNQQRIWKFCHTCRSCLWRQWYRLQGTQWQHSCFCDF